MAIDAGEHPITVPRPSPGRRRLGALAVAALALLFSACVTTTTSGTDLHGRVDRLPPNREYVAGTVSLVNAFGVDLYRSVAGDRGNFVYSPYAVLTSLAMVRAGSAPGSTTRQQFDDLLHVALTPDLDTGLNTIDQGLTSRTGDKSSATRKGKVSLEFATALWIQRNTHVKQDLLDVLASHYGSDVHAHLVDFRSDAEAARQAINSWGADATHGHLEELVTRGGVTQQTRLVAGSESWLQAPWELPFDRAKTKRAPFNRADDQPESVQMMELAAPTGVRYADKTDWIAIEVPYLSSELSLVVVVPPAGGLDAFEAGFTPDRLKEITTALEPQAVDLRLPEFQVETTSNLDDQLGPKLPAAFGPDADFSSITSDEAMALSQVVTKGFFGVNEEGTNATASATADPGTDPAMDDAKTVNVDRPFLFFVRDRESGLVLEIGRVVSP